MKKQSLSAALPARSFSALGTSLAVGASLALCLTGTTFAADTGLRLTLNGAALPETAIVVNGKTYVPVSALTRLGVKATAAGGVLNLSTGAAAPASTTANGAGGAGQKASVSGCVNEYLFNGVWRFRVTKVAVMTDPSRGDYPYYSVTAELKNGTTKTIKPVDAGIETSTAVALAFSDGDSLTYNYRSDWVDKTFGKVLQGTGFVYNFPFYPGEKLPLDQVQANKPQKLLFEVDPAKLDKDLKIGFTVPDPSFRVDLTCTR